MERYTIVIETRHGATIRQKVRSLASARRVFNDEIAWESTKRITIYDPQHQVVVSEPGDFAFVD